MMSFLDIPGVVARERQNFRRGRERSKTPVVNLAG
jgi:hypothetical protein